MVYKAAIFLIFLLSGLNIYAQNKLNGTYYPVFHLFTCTDPNIVVKEFVNGRAAFMIKGRDPFDYKSNKVGFIDATGKVIIKPYYINCSNFRGDFALVQDTANMLGVVNASGKIIIPFARQNITFCENGLFICRTYTKNSGISIVDSRGRTIVPFGRYSASAVPNSVYPPQVTEGNDMPDRQFYWRQLQVYVLPFNKFIGVKKGDKWAAINLDGKEIIPAKFDWVGVFTDGVAAMTVDKKFGIIDTAGNVLVPPVYENLALTSNHFAIAIQNNKSGVISIGNKLLIPFKYDFIEQTAGGAFLVSTGQRYSDNSRLGIINKKGKTIIEIKNRYVSYFGSGFLVNRNNDSTAVFDSAGVRKTAYVRGGRLEYPVWDMGDEQGYMVYNKRKRDFIHYEKVSELMYYDDDKWGLLDSAGEEVIKPQYNEFWYMWSKKFIAVRQNNKWGFINTRGEKMTDVQYDEIDRSGGEYLLKVKKDGKYGLLNSTCNLVLPIKYDNILVNQNGLNAYVYVTLNNKKGLLDEFGREIIPVKYDAIAGFYNGFSQVTTDKKIGLVNTKGVEVVPCVYDNLQFERGSPLILVSQNNLYGLIDYNGKIIQPVVCKSLRGETLNGKRIYIMERNGKTGMADAAGKQIFPFKYDYANKMDTYASTTSEMRVSNNGCFGVASLSGELMVPTIYDQVWRENAGAARKIYGVVSGGMQGIVDEKGKVLIPCAYKSLSQIRDKSLIASKGNRLGIIDWQQKEVVPFIYDNITATQTGYIVRLNDKAGVLGPDGKEIIPIAYDSIDGYFQNVFFLRKGGKSGMADSAGKIIVPVIYDSFNTCGNETILVKKDNLFGLIHYTGKVIYPCKYTFINCVDGKVVEIY